MECIKNDVWGDTYSGTIDTRIDLPARKGHHADVEFAFHADARDIEHCFLLCRYAAS